MTPTSPRRRAAVVGLGARAQLYTEALTGPARRPCRPRRPLRRERPPVVHHEWIAAAHPAGRPYRRTRPRTST